MVKSKSSTPKTKKVRATKYTKLAAHVTKELNVKKRALVKAEKALSRAQQTHQDLLSEVARLDMLDRSLKAVNEKTTPPQNVKYVYTYPYWVWNPGYTYTVPSYTPQSTFTTPAPPSFCGTYTNTPASLSGGLSNGGYAQGGVLTTNASSPVSVCSGLNNGTITCTLANASNVTVNTTGSSVSDPTPADSCLMFSSPSSNWTPQTSFESDTLVVDLTTHAPETEADITAELVAKAG